MPRILLSASFPPDLILRQTPGRTGRWEEFELTANDRDEVDGWVVYDNLRAPQNCRCRPSNTLLITGEPESLRRYRSRFTAQFSQVWTSHRSILHPRVTMRNEAQPWHYGLRAGRVHGCQLGFDELVKMQRPKKTKLLSVICSSKAHTEDHRRRLAFLEPLKAHFGDQLDVFGRGIQEVPDKSDAIYDYKYHIVLENDHSDYFMTEKLCDAFLGFSYPIYFGGSEAYHRFPEGSFTAIDIYRPDEAINLIENVIRSDAYSANQSQVDEARRRVLHENNLCSMIAAHFREQGDMKQSRDSIHLVPKEHRATLIMKQIGRRMLSPFRGDVAPGPGPSSSGRVA
ncbi:MAG: glycosyltransferase family 10 domain-containing protein [Aureliella sp.]